MFEWWIAVTTGPGALAWQSNEVVALRIHKFATEGLASAPEASLMVNEKIAAFCSAVAKLSTGTFPDVILGDLRAVVDANVRRLSAD